MLSSQNMIHLRADQETVTSCSDNDMMEAGPAPSLLAPLSQSRAQKCLTVWTRRRERSKMVGCDPEISIVILAKVNPTVNVPPGET